MKSQLHQSLEQQRQINDELAQRDERIVSMKVDIVSTEERLKLKEDEVRKITGGVSRYHSTHIAELLQSWKWHHLGTA